MDGTRREVREGWGVVWVALALFHAVGWGSSFIRAQSESVPAPAHLAIGLVWLVGTVILALRPNRPAYAAMLVLSGGHVLLAGAVLPAEGVGLVYILLEVLTLVALVKSQGAMRAVG